LYSSPNDNWEAENFARTHWTAEVLSSEEKFREATLRVTSGVYECYTFDSPHAARFLYRCFSAARGFIREEPFLTILDYNTASSAGHLANWYACEHKFDEALELIREAWAMLDAKDARRELVGLPPAPTTAPRVMLLTTLADIKWRYESDQIADSLLTPKQQAQVWLRYCNRVADWYKQRPDKEEALRHEMERMLWAGLYVAACALRYAPDSLDGIVDQFNIEHEERFGGLGLRRGTRHADAETSAPDTPWYWHFEIIKSWLPHAVPSTSAEFDDTVIGELDTMYDRLVIIARDWILARSNSSYLGSVLRDRNWMRAKLLARKMGLNVLPAGAS
jgi:hypothetical protein